LKETEPSAPVQATVAEVATHNAPDAPATPTTVTPEPAEPVSAEQVEATEADIAVSPDGANTDAGWEQVPEKTTEVAQTATPVSEPNREVEEAPPVEEPIEAADITSTDGITSEGRATNDPRVESRPVGEMEIATTHTPLFGEVVAPPAQPSGRSVARSSNDPRGPKTDPLAQAASQS
jgi:ribonuclease E